MNYLNYLIKYFWLNSNFLKLNMDKTEIIITGTPSLISKIPTDFACDIAVTLIKSSSTVKNVGVIFFYSSLTFETHINSASTMEVSLLQ